MFPQGCTWIPLTVLLVLLLLLVSPATLGRDWYKIQECHLQLALKIQEQQEQLEQSRKWLMFGCRALIACDSFSFICPVHLGLLPANMGTMSKLTTGRDITLMVIPAVYSIFT